MKKLTQLAAAIALTAGAMSAAPVMAEGSFSANVGLASEYYYRGILQKQSDSGSGQVSASGGLDYENGGFGAGVWTADVGDGLEVDVYASYGIETESGISASLGYTSYQYTGDFDTEYNEANLNLGYGIASFEYSVGEHEVEGGSDEDYTFVALTLEHNGFSATYGSFSDDWDGDYVQLGYGTEIGGFDTSIALIFGSDDLGPEGSQNVNGDDEAIVFSIGKSFDL